MPVPEPPEAATHIMNRRIGLNAVFLNPGRTGGAETYTRRLLHHLQQLPGDEEFVVYLPRETDVVLTNPRFSSRLCDVDPRKLYQRVLWEQWTLPGLLRRERFDLVHFPYSTLALSYQGRTVTTVHDTLRFCFPEQMTLVTKAYKALMEGHIVRQRQHVIAVSHHDAGLFQKHTQARPEHLSAVYHGVDEAFRRQAWSADRALAADPLELLWIGRPYPHKNLGVLIESLKHLTSRVSRMPRLSLVGVEPPYARGVASTIDRAGVSAFVSVEPPLPFSQIADRLLRATLVVCPSQYESFGLPVLEACALGIPVLCAEHPVFRELWGDAVAYADPTSPPSFADQIAHLLTHPDQLTSLAHRGQTHSRRYTWEACAQETLNVYRHLLDGGSPTD